MYITFDSRSLFTLMTLSVCAMLFMGCEDVVTAPISIDGLVVMNEPDRGPPAEIDQEIREIDRMPQPEDMRVVDMERAPDMMLIEDMSPELLPDGEVPMGDRCDPRLRAPACEPGFVCLPVPGGRINQGRCVAGDGCMMTGESGCPEDQPYCHLRGRSTECTQPSTRGLGEVCLDDFNRSLPCAAGLVCNFSTCVPPCDPTQSSDEQCGSGRECVDLTDQLGHVGGFCGAVASCDLFTNQGCEANQQCSFAVRADDQALVYFCTEAGTVGEGEPCLSGQGQGPGDCEAGLLCIASPEGSSYCKRLCDTGAYQAPCPDGQSCREILSQGGGQFVRTIGLCVINR